MLPDPISAYQNAPLAELLTILLRQFKRPLASKGIALDDAEAAEIAQAISEKQSLSEKALQIRTALGELIRESEAVLAGWNLTFAQSLETEMGTIPGWQTTAEFLEIANQKTNAELRISTGSALAVALGDKSFVPHLETLITRAEPDLDTVIAARVMAL
jgi:hypothetical protein